MREVPDLKYQGFVPELALMSSKDTPWNIRDFLRRKNIVIYFMSDIYCDKCRARLRAFALDHDHWLRLRAEIAAVLPNSPEELDALAHELDLPFTLLADPTGRARSAFSFPQVDAVKTPALFVVDRFAILYHHPLNDQADVWREESDIYKEVEWLESQCPECGAYG